jgi:tetratricopeptide (TPR) repeat protein
MVDLRALLIAVVAALALPAPALGFRNIPVDSAVPALTLAAAGRRVEVPPPGRATVVLFWRPGQAFSEEALADLAALSPALVAKGVAVVALAEAGSKGGRVPPPPIEATTDQNRQASDAFGVIVFPSTAVIDARGVLRAYVPSRNSNYRRLVEAYTLRALGEISDAEVTVRLVSVGEVHGRDAEAALAAYKRGTALASERRHEEAARELARALALQPDLIEAHLGLGYARLDTHEAAQALREFEFVLAKHPTSPGARVGVGIARIRLGHVDEGIRLLEEAVVLNPEPVRGHYELGRAYEARGDAARAVHHYRWAFLKLFQGRK